MKTYPKVPRHDHPTVEEDLYTADDLVLLEKVDGSNFRLFLYDERFASDYSDEFKQEHNPEDGEVYFGSKNVIRGTLTMDTSEIDGSFGRILDALRDALDQEALREFHTEYESPLLLFGEHMVRHTLDYEYESDPPPAFIGFDALALADAEETPEDPFDERFSGFLTLDEAFEVFTEIGLETITVLEREAGPLDPENISVPVSSYGNIQAEGIVIRSDTNNRRTKFVTEQFRELMQKAWGLDEATAANGAELFVARYLTNSRIRKHIQRLIKNYPGPTITEITEAVVSDAWHEEWHEVSTYDKPLIPREIYPLAEVRCEEVLDIMKTNSALNDAEMETLWEDTTQSQTDTDVNDLQIDTSTLSAFEREVIQVQGDNVEAAIVQELLGEEDIHTSFEEIVEESDRNPGRWAAGEIHDDLYTHLWATNLALIANLSVEFVPSDLEDELMDWIIEVLNNRDDVEVDEKDDDWEPSPDDADTSGLGSLF